MRLLCCSGINLSFFRRTDYSFQLVFYLLWSNCLIAFAFLLSSLFRSSKTGEGGGVGGGGGVGWRVHHALHQTCIAR